MDFKNKDLFFVLEFMVFLFAKNTIYAKIIKI